MGAVNPIIPGFAPDPSIVRVDDTFFLVNSTFQFFPGLPIFASKDLVSWTQIGNALHKPSQADFSHSAAKLSLWQKRVLMVGNRGLYAPTIRYNSGTFYIIVSNVTEGSDGEQSDSSTHLILSTTNIYANDWSDPVTFDFDGGDPSLFFEEDRAYVQIANAADTTIHQFEIDVATGKQLTESKEILPHSGRKWAESPHIYKRGAYYYLLIAEGGCFEHHVISVARSKDLWGPYENHPHNPILTAFGTTEYIQHVGHADFVEDIHGDWWAVCLGVRKRDDDHYPLGRETFLSPVGWVNDWPVISTITMECSDGEGGHKLPLETKPETPVFPPVSPVLHIRQKDMSKYDIRDDGYISLIPGPFDISDAHGSVTFAGVCQRQLEGEFSVRMSLATDGSPSNQGTRAGLALYKDELRRLRIFYDFAAEEVCFEGYNKAKEWADEKRVALKSSTEITFIIQYSELEYRLYYRFSGSDEKTLMGTVDSGKMTNLDFVGPVIGVFAVHGDLPSNDTPMAIDFTEFQVT